MVSKVRFTVLLGMVFKVVPTPGHAVHDLLEPDVKVLRVQHLIDMVEYKEHQLALCPHQSAVLIQGVGIMPILEQFQEVHPLTNTMDPHVGLVVLAAGGGPWALFVGLFSVFINSIGITGDRNLIPLVVATNAVMVLAITRWAMVALLCSTIMLRISASYAFLSRLPCRYRMKSFGFFLKLLYGGLGKCW